jgi:thioredoxin 1
MKTSSSSRQQFILALGVVIVVGVIVILFTVMEMHRPTSGREGIGVANFDREVLSSKVPVLVDFYADWCGPCRAFAPILDEFAREFPHVKIVRVNVDENPKLAAKYEIEFIPSLLVFRNGKLSARHVGAADKTVLKKLLASER